MTKIEKQQKITHNCKNNNSRKNSDIIKIKIAKILKITKLKNEPKIEKQQTAKITKIANQKMQHKQRK